MDGTEILVARGMRRAFGGIVAVANVSLSVRSGEVLGLIGPNGSGKSTLLNLLTGTLTADAGEIILDGRDLTSRVPYERARRGVVRLFQQSRIFPSLTLQENLRVIAGGTSDETAKVLLQKVGLLDRLEDLAGELSYGQQRLLEFTRVLALKPRVVLLDEPTAGVHPKIVETMRSLIAELREDNAAIIIVEHNVEFIASLADRLMGLADGKVIADGSPEEVLRNPELIAAYFGDGTASTHAA